MRKTVLMCVASIAALTTAIAAPACADTTDDLLRSLRDKGILTQQEYETLARRNAGEQAAKIATVAPSGEGASNGNPAQAIDPHLVRMMDSGVGMQIGPVDLKFSGSINGFYVYDSAAAPAPNRVVAGGLATVGQSTSSVRNGLLPGFLRIDVTTNQGGWDVGAHFGLYPGIDSVTGVGGANSAGSPDALATSGIDARQTYLTVSHAGFGELKIGRDIGLFGSDAILNDMTLLGVGTAAGNSAPSNTTLGRIGLGYIYTDFQPQITYTTPNLSGLQASVGIFQPLVTAGGSESNSTPGFQAKLTYDHKFDAVATHLWADFITQKHDSTVGAPNYTADGFDLGAKLSYGPASLLGYYYDGKGIGTIGLFILATDAAGQKRDSSGFYVQGTFSPVPKLTLGASYGQSHLGLAPGEVNPTLLDTNSSYVGQIRYSLTSWVNLVGEFTHTHSTAHGGDDASSDAVSAGAIMFF